MPDYIINLQFSLPVVILENLQDFTSELFSSSPGPGPHQQAYVLSNISPWNQVDSLNDYVKFLSKSMRIFIYFGKVFDYGLPFRFSSGNIKN